MILHHISRRYFSSKVRERTFLMIKPDGVQRCLVGRIISRFEQKGLKLVAMKYTLASEELLRKHYANLAGKKFLPELLKYMSSGPVVPMIWEGLDAVKICRSMLGVTNPGECARGTLRGDLSIHTGRNLCHGSDSVESAKNEIALWFNEKDIIKWTQTDEIWVYED